MRDQANPYASPLSDTVSSGEIRIRENTGQLRLVYIGLSLVYWGVILMVLGVFATIASVFAGGALASFFWPWVDLRPVVWEGSCR